MAHSNIDKFNEITGRLFADLYNSFPRPLQVTTADYMEDLVPLADPVEETVRIYAQCSFVADSIKWLLDAGFISASSHNADFFYNVILTEKGLECLKKTPDSALPSTGTQLSDAVKMQSAEAVKAFASSVISAGVSVAFRHAGLI